jgi:hypothetical protein
LRVRATIGGARLSLAAGLAVAATILTLSAAQAQDAPLPLQNAAPQQQDAAPPSDTDQSPLHSLAKGLGFATDVAPPPDFVQQSRPATPQQEIPVFTPPAEPPGKIKSAKEVEAIDSDLEAIVKRDDALRAGYAPSARAVAAAAAAKKAKSKPKLAPTPPL